MLLPCNASSLHFVFFSSCTTDWCTPYSASAQPGNVACCCCCCRPGLPVVDFARGYKMCQRISSTQCWKCICIAAGREKSICSEERSCKNKLLKNKGRRWAEEIVLLALPFLPQKSRTNLFYQFPYLWNGHNCLFLLHWNSLRLYCLQNQVGKCYKMSTLEFYLPLLGLVFAFAHCHQSHLYLLSAWLTYIDRERWVQLLDGQMAPSSANWMWCTPSYQYTSVHLNAPLAS